MLAFLEIFRKKNLLDLNVTQSLNDLFTFSLFKPSCYINHLFLFSLKVIINLLDRVSIFCFFDQENNSRVFFSISERDCFARSVKKIL